MVTVKPLQWSKHDEAVGFDCRYTVYKSGDGWNCVKYPHGQSHFRLAEGVPEQKARDAAYDDYSAQVLAVLEEHGG